MLFLFVIGNSAVDGMLFSLVYLKFFHFLQARCFSSLFSQFFLQVYIHLLLPFNLLIYHSRIVFHYFFLQFLIFYGHFVNFTLCHVQLPSQTDINQVQIGTVIIVWTRLCVLIRLITVILDRLITVILVRLIIVINIMITGSRSR